MASRSLRRAFQVGLVDVKTKETLFTDVVIALTAWDALETIVKEQNVQWDGMYWVYHDRRVGGGSVPLDLAYVPRGEDTTRWCH